MIYKKSIMGIVSENACKEINKKIDNNIMKPMVRRIADAAMKILQEKRMIMGGTDILKGKKALQYCDLLEKAMGSDDFATSIAAERLLREELRKAYDGHCDVNVIDKIEPILVLKDL